ncbi:DNA-packaging protein [Pseudomonas sp. F(2018)]|uniref:DNA-packaging protein n=1 Tax=Pseudomonas sp. F(2018) TaxID=2502240 RepID=UPI00148503A1|nr:DNA-packaging protein [Pseudomonas sp. F(2018)]
MNWLDTLRKLLPLALLVALLLAWYLLIESWKATAYDQGYSKAADEGALALEQLRGEHRQLELERARAAEASAKAAAKRLQEEQARNDQLASQLADQQRTHRQTTDRLSGEIARVNDLYRKALDAEPEPLPACVFTRGFVRVWDEATGARTAVPEAADPGRAAAQGTEGRAVDQLDSGLSQNAVLAHHVRYAEQCRNVADQLDALIDAVQEKQ